MVMYIHIAICIISVGINSDISKFKQLECSTLSLYCTVSFTGCSAKKTLKSLLHWERLRITQETLQISLFASVFKFSKENCFALPFYCAVLCTGCSTKEGLSDLLHREFLRKNEETLQISVNLVKNVSYFFMFIILPCVQSAQNDLINWLGHVTNINICLIILNLAKKLFHSFILLHYSTYRVLERNLR